MEVFLPTTFNDWRNAARGFLKQNLPPTEIHWSKSSALLVSSILLLTPPSVDTSTNVPQQFLKLASVVADHRDSERWGMLYLALWRLTHGEGSFLSNPADELALELQRMARQVAKDEHKMHAFVRFKKAMPNEEYYVAWHRPDHLILQRAAPFFQRRFGNFAWSIFTPDGSAHWDGLALTYGEGMPQQDFLTTDETDSLWQQYYKSVFNPARANQQMMLKEMPRRYWSALPEAELIPGMLADAAKRTKTMEEQRPQRAEPPETNSLAVLHESLLHCQSCPIGQCINGQGPTQSVMGEGDQSASIMLVGEQPGDEEDLAGRPFIGPAGQVLDRVLNQVSLEKKACYVTNAVKHFKFAPRGKRRIHQRPTGAEMNACRPWLQKEIEIVRPKIIVCLGATAAHAILGKTVTIESMHNRRIQMPQGFYVYVTYHPSATLRAEDPQKSAEIFQKIAETLHSVKYFEQRLKSVNDMGVHSSES